jgi:hypothetical protein
MVFHSSLAQIRALFESAIPALTALDGDYRKAGSTKDDFPTRTIATTKVTLMKRLEELGWDLQSRLYLGFSSKRLHITVKAE